MAEPTLNQAILNLTNDELKKQRPLPSKVTITTIHSNGYIDIQDSDGNIQKNIQVIGNSYDVGDIGILFHLANNELVVLTK